MSSSPCITYRFISMFRALAARPGSVLSLLCSSRAAARAVCSSIHASSREAVRYMMYSPATAHFSRRSLGYSRSSASQEAPASSSRFSSKSFRRSSSRALISSCSSAGRKSSSSSTVIPSIRARGHSMATSGMAALVSHLLTAALVTPRAAASCSWVSFFSRRRRCIRFPISIVRSSFSQRRPSVFRPRTMVTRPAAFYNGGAVGYRRQFLNCPSTEPLSNSAPAPGPAWRTAFPPGAPPPGCGTAPPRSQRRTRPSAAGR